MAPLALTLASVSLSCACAAVEGNNARRTPARIAAAAARKRQTWLGHGTLLGTTVDENGKGKGERKKGLSAAAARVTASIEIRQPLGDQSAALAAWR
jgi:hypothetical protein